MMSAERFEAERAAEWDELDAALRAAGDRPERLGRDGVRRLGDALPLGRRRPRLRAPALPGRPADARASRRWCCAARAAVYARAARRASIVAVPDARLLAAARRAAGADLRGLGAAARAGGAGCVWGPSTPPRPPGSSRASSRARRTRPPRAATSTPRRGGVLLPGDDQQHPGDVDGVRGRDHLRALTVDALFFNGLILGVIGGLAIGGRQRRRVPAADLLARAAGDLLHRRRRVAGLRIGWALIRPGPLRRGDVVAARGAPGGGDRGGHDPVARRVRLLRGLPDGARAARSRLQAAIGRRAVRAVLGARVGARPPLTGPRAPWPAGRRRPRSARELVRRRFEHPRAGRPDLCGGARAGARARRARRAARRVGGRSPACGERLEGGSDGSRRSPRGGG